MFANELHRPGRVPYAGYGQNITYGTRLQILRVIEYKRGEIKRSRAMAVTCSGNVPR